MLTDELLLAWWRLARLPGIGNISLNELRSRLGDSTELLTATSASLLQLGLNSDAAACWQDDPQLNSGFTVLQRWRQQPGCGVLLAGIPPYPEALAATRDAPTFLYFRGDLNALQRPAVAMVGSRNPTPYASEWAKNCARELASAGVAVVSGLALGIDGAAHSGAVESGVTIAVLGCGADVIYPKRHSRLVDSILSNGGLILSEFPPGTAPQASHFPSRNRIISGLSLGVVVVEAAIKSGSLITARQAAEQGREVFALPGAVTNPLSRGCHHLIKDGAVLVESASYILQELGLETLSADSHPQAGLFDQPASADSPASALISHIDFTATSTDVIAIRSQLPVHQLLPQLLQLELSGWLRQVPGGYMRVR